MKYYIPSYHRLGRQKTLEYLSGLGYGPESIIIATQTEDDYRGYSETYSGKARIVYGQAHNCAGNRNTLIRLMAPGERAVILDDDIKSIDQLMPICGKQHNKFGIFRAIDTRDELESLIATAFDICAQAGADIWGMYTVYNERMIYKYYVSGQYYSLDTIFVGTVFGMVNTGRYFDTNFETKEDYEYLLRDISAGGHTVRLNWYSPKTDHFEGPGGCTETRLNKERYVLDAATLQCKYPQYITLNRSKPGEIRMIRGR